MLKSAHMERQPLYFPVYPREAGSELTELRVLQKQRFNQFVKPTFNPYLVIAPKKEKGIPAAEVELQHQRLFLAQAFQLLEEWLDDLPENGCYLGLFHNIEPDKPKPYFTFNSTRTNSEGYHTIGTMGGAQALINLFTPEWELQLNMTYEEAEQRYQRIALLYENPKKAPAFKREWLISSNLKDHKLFRFSTLLPGLAVIYSYWLDRPAPKQRTSVVLDSFYTPLLVNQLPHHFRKDDFWS